MHHRTCWGKLKDASTRCVLRPEDASKCVYGRDSTRPPSWIWGGEWRTKGAIGMVRERKEQKGREEREKEEGGNKISGEFESLA